MGLRTSYDAGTFCWVDLGTSDLSGSRAFYEPLFGWEADEVPEGSGGYTMMRRDGHHVAALYPKQDEGVPTAWLSYVAVDDLDATLDRAGGLGAATVTDVFAAEPHGRGAVIADPTGAVLGLWQGGEHPGAGLVNAPGALTMNELDTGDVERAAEFYRQAFGWSVQRIPQAEPPYWTITNGGRLNGGARELDAGAPGPFWLAYFAVDDAEAATQHARALGGRVLAEPFAIPAGRFAVIADPQGGVLALFEGTLDD
jgi:uncharacterized protein